MSNKIAIALQAHPTPRTTFASDNSAGAHPLIMDALLKANSHHALAYGSDDLTAMAQDNFKKLFGQQAEAFLVFGGSGANVMALATMLQAGECVVCSDKAHIALDETGAAERALGAKLLMLPTTDGKIKPAQLEALNALVGVQHHAQPGVLSITQPTELGVLYTAAEIKELCDTAHRMDMRVHLDGARIANATAALGGDAAALRSFTSDVGVDVVCFGGTKAGLMFGEAVIYLKPTLAKRAKYVRKQVNQLPSKMRFVAAQFNALLHDDLWIELAQHANAMSARLYHATKNISGVAFDAAPEVNSMFPSLPAATIEPLADWCKFWEWDATRAQVRWMTAWDTTEADVDSFAAGIQAALATTQS